jgi:GWxTD domain-containing protein
MPPRNKTRLSLLLLACLLFSTVRSNSVLRAEETAQSCYEKAVVMLKDGDSSTALGLLDRALELDSKHGPALIERGRLYLSQDLRDKARWDFTQAVGDEDPRIKALAHVGLGDISRPFIASRVKAKIEYRRALEADSTCREAYFAMAQTGFLEGGSLGYQLASEGLAGVIYLDPEYHGAFSLWQDKIITPTDDDLRKVSIGLGNYLPGHPEKSPWWWDQANCLFRLVEDKKALDALDKLGRSSPEFKPSERFLLKARCLLELGDTLGFEACYDSSLKAAEKDGDFTQLRIEAEPVFTPEEYEKAASLRTAEDFVAFFRTFWKRRDPDPLSLWNERLVTHYQRLREVEKIYRLNNPHGRFQNSRDYQRLVLIQQGAADTYEDYDPDIFFQRCRTLYLDQRGLLYLRHGPPDRIEVPEAPSGGPPKETQRVWRYGNAHFAFEMIRGAGDFLFRPIYADYFGSIKKAMETESFDDPLPACEQNYYGADFMGRDGYIEMEFYQSVPAGAVPSEKAPEAAVAFYDNSWNEITRSISTSSMVVTGSDSTWIAVNRLLIDPGPFYYALRMDIPGCRAVIRNELNITQYQRRRLDLSGIMIGTTPNPAYRAHRRMGVDLLPRPSLTFEHGERIMVYLEVYGLKEVPWSERSFRESVTVTLDEEKSGGILKALKPWSKKLRKSLTLSFDRSPSEATGPIPEYFEIDTTGLVPGIYFLSIEVRDKNSRQRKKIGAFFTISPSEKNKS